MWTKPYGMKEGFLIGGGLIIAGLMLDTPSHYDGLQLLLVWSYSVQIK